MSRPSPHASTRPVRVVAAAGAELGPGELEDLFPGRWNPRRPLLAGVRPLAQAARAALEQAGWWTPGTGAPVTGGLVIGVDQHGWGAAARFQAQHLPPGRTLRPGEFLASLPSTPAATLGLLFGLPDLQTTLAAQGLSGLAAVGHAADLVALGRLERAVAGALSRVEAPLVERLVGAGLLPPDAAPFTLAVVWCLEAGPRPGRELLAWPARDEPPAGARDTGELLLDVPSGYRSLAAPGLLAATRVLEQGEGERWLVHRDPWAGSVALGLR